MGTGIIVPNSRETQDGPSRHENNRAKPTVPVQPMRVLCEKQRAVLVGTQEIIKEHF